MTYHQTRHLKSGPRVDVHSGLATLTDTRLIFSSETKSFQIKHGKVLDLVTLTRAIEVRSGGQGAGKYDFGRNRRLAGAIYRAAVAKANQTLVESRDGAPSRHIPRDIRQRVWQKYGGVCAECGSNQYLEFDHIVPRAKGGSNSEANVQLLCRKCNLAKSDRI